MARMLLAAAVALTAAMGLTDGAGQTVEVDGLVIADGSARTAGGVARSAAGYFTITNTGEEDDRLLGVESAAAQRVELHSHELENGIARMVALDEGVPVPAGETVTFAPGGHHVMFMGLRDPWGAEGGVVVNLLFERTGEVPVTLAVERVGHRHRPDAAGETGGDR